MFKDPTPLFSKNDPSFIHTAVDPDGLICRVTAAKNEHGQTCIGANPKDFDWHANVTWRKIREPIIWLRAVEGTAGSTTTYNNNVKSWNELPKLFKDVIKDAAAIFGDSLQYFERTKKARGYATYMRLRATEYKTRVNDPDMCLPKAQKQVKVKKSLTTNLVFFYGDSGSGKTAYAKYFLRNLGYDNIDEIQWQPDREKFTYDKTDSATSARAIIIDEIPKERSIPIKYINVWHDPTTSKIPGMYCNVTNLAEYMIFISNQSPHEIWGKQEDFNQLQRRFGVAYKFEKVVKRGTQTSYCRPVYFSSGASIRGRPKEDITEFVRADVPKAYTDVLNIGCEIAQDDLQIEDGEDD
jgi:hypothetical protein